MTAPTDLDAAELTRRLRARELSATEVMAAVLDRIEAVNPKVNAVVSLLPRDDLMAAARAADAGPVGGALHGLPMAVKDLQATKGIRTTWGSPVWKDHVPEADDLLPARLRAAGAILIGKTNTPEFGLGSHTFNPVHGATRNPYDLTRSAGGSSGGAAAALACRMLPLADGSDMMGSLRNPAAFNNVWGFRPSHGLVPDDAVGDMYLHLLATDGPMARNPADLALLLSVLAGPEPLRPWNRPVPDLTLTPEAKGRRIGWLGDWGGALPVEAGILDLCEDALRDFEALGAEVEPVPPPMPAERVWEAWTTLRSFAVAGGQAAAYADAAVRAQMKPALLWEIERGLAVTGRQIQQASETRSDLFRAFALLFERYDALALPSAQVWPFPVDWVHPEAINGRAMDTYHRWMEVVAPVSLTGLPALGMPVGFGPRGLPMGMQLFGRMGADAAVLSLGAAFHAARPWSDRAPKL